MLAGGNLVGILNVNVTHGRQSFTLGQVKTLRLLVNIISPMLENTALHIQRREAEEKYRSIFENATAGIYQTTTDGRFISANPAMAKMLGYDSPEELISTVTDIGPQSYLNPESLAAFTSAEHGQERECTLYRKDGTIFWGSDTFYRVVDDKGQLLYYEGMLTDISGRKTAENRQILTNNILEMLNLPADRGHLFQDILLLLKQHAGVDAVGIRLKEGDDFPYSETSGFPEHFLEKDAFLCARNDAGDVVRDSQGQPCLACLCGKVLCGCTDPALPFFTERGSFWTNSTTELSASAWGKEIRSHLRNHCNEAGYESVALIPLKSGDEPIGLLQLNDSRKNALTEDLIKFLEGIGASIGIALARKTSLETLRESEKNYRLLADNVSDVISVTDLNMKCLFMTPSIEKLFGWTEEEYRALDLQEMLPPQDLEKSLKVVEKELARDNTVGVDPQRSWMSELEAYRKDGSTLWVEETSSFLRDDQGTAIGVIGVVRNITRRRKHRSDGNGARSIASCVPVLSEF
jgi:PAS domain S-box-containing protein